MHTTQTYNQQIHTHTCNSIANDNRASCNWSSVRVSCVFYGNVGKRCDSGIDRGTTMYGVLYMGLDSLGNA